MKKAGAKDGTQMSDTKRTQVTVSVDGSSEWKTSVSGSAESRFPSDCLCGHPQKWHTSEWPGCLSRKCRCVYYIATPLSEVRHDDA